MFTKYFLKINLSHKNILFKNQNVLFNLILGDSGIRTIANAIKESSQETKIKNLDISNNEVTAIGLGFIMEAL